MRRLKDHEVKIIKRLLQQDESVFNKLMSELDRYFVEEMDDGGMGSLRFIPHKGGSRRLGKTIGELEFRDVDKIPIFVSLNLDSDGDLFELDIWKVDYSEVLEIQSE